jgi:hypothetical protein
MLPLADLKRSQERDFHRALADSHRLRVRVQVLDLMHDVLNDLTDYLEDGQVNIDADGEITRNLTLSFLDRKGAVDFDSDSPADGALYLNRMLRVIYSVYVDALTEWVDVPIFTGPVTKVDRAGQYVNVECQGKEILSLGGERGAAWEPLTVKKGVAKVDAIRRIMRERGGEHRFDLPDLVEKLPKRVSLGRESSAWEAAQKIAESIGEGGRHLFYDGRGELRLRRFPGNPVFTFRDGPGGMVLTDPQVAFSTDGVRNAVWIKGGTPKSKKDDDEETPKKEKERGVRHLEAAPRAHPLSPWRLGRDDHPRYLLEVVENDKIRSKKAARELADRLLKKRLRSVVDVTFDALPLPTIEPEDEIRVEPLGQVVRLNQASLPLKHDGVMSVGYLRRVSNRRRGRNRK